MKYNRNKAETRHLINHHSDYELCWLSADAILLNCAGFQNAEIGLHSFFTPPFHGDSLGAIGFAILQT